MSKAKDLLADFSRTREVVKKNDSNTPVRKTRDFNKSRKTRVAKGKPYRDKIESGDIDKLSSKDLLDFFRDLAIKNGVKFVASKPVIDMRNFNLAIERGYSIEEILLMLEFLFESEQDYLDKKRLHPGILLTGWCNKIYADSQDWLNDEYKTDSQAKHSKREWSEEIPEEDQAIIGEWGDI